MQQNKSLGLNAVLNSLQSLLNLIFPLITFPYISRTLSVDGVGEYNFANSIVSYFILLAGLGISVYAVREGAKFRHDRQKFSQFASKIFTINIVSTVIAYLTLFLALALSTSLQKYNVAILVFSIQIFFTTLGVDWIYTIYEEYGYITVRNIVFKVISLILLFIFVRHRNDCLNYIVITVIASTGSYLLNFFHAKEFCDIRLVFRFNWREYLVPIFTIFATTVAIKIYLASDVTMIGLIKGDYSVGIYSTATKIYSIVGAMLSAMTAVAIPRLAMLMGQKRMDEYQGLLDQLINTLLMIILPGIIGLFMLSKDVILIIAGEKYLRATPALQITCFAILGSAMSTVFNQCALMPAKREKKTLISSTTSAVLNIGLNFILIPMFAEVGAAFTTVLAEFMMMTMNFFFSRDITGFVFKDKQTWKNIFSSLIGCFGIASICRLSSTIFNSIFIRVLASVTGSVFIYIAILLLLRNKVAVGLLKQLTSRLGRS